MYCRLTWIKLSYIVLEINLLILLDIGVVILLILVKLVTLLKDNKIRHVSLMQDMFGKWTLILTIFSNLYSRNLIEFYYIQTSTSLNGLALVPNNQFGNLSSNCP